MKKQSDKQAAAARQKGRLRRTLCLVGTVALVCGGAIALLRRYSGGGSGR